MPARITVVGSVNLDVVAFCERLPWPGETLTDAELERVPGGKGANQAVAAARLASAPDRSSLWAGLFDLRENLFGAADDLRALAA